MRTDFTFLGHNCFLIETGGEALLIDPWLGDTGAFYGSWHQWPPNSHLRELVTQRCANKSLSIFLTHEHQDHFDKSTLRAFASHPRCTVFIPAYRDRFLLEELDRLNLHTTELADGEQAGEEIGFRIFIDDNGINHDSMIFVKTEDFTFLNQNDCKIFDRLPVLSKELGPIDYYSVQFSGANWHPACFDLPDDQRRQLAKKKVLQKLRNVLGAARILAPRFLVPAAGPAFFPFLDPALNADSGTIFIHQDELDTYLVKNGITQNLYPRPGEKVSEESNRSPIPRPTPGEIAHYRAGHADVWESIADDFTKARFAGILQRRLDMIAGLALPPETPVIGFKWGPAPDEELWVDLAHKTLALFPAPQAPYMLVHASTKYFSLMCGEERWQDIALSLHARIERQPDIYNTIANIFLFAQESTLAESMGENLNLSKERIVIEHLGQRFEINRYCPHQGGDLTYALIGDDMHVICPRHSWRFDLNCEGRCKHADASINAVRLDVDADAGGAPPGV